MTSRDTEYLDSAYNPDLTWPEAGVGLLDTVGPRRKRDFLFDLRVQRGDNMERAPERKAFVRNYYWRDREHLQPRQEDAVLNEQAMAMNNFWMPKEAPEYALPLFGTYNYSSITERHYNKDDLILLQRGTF